MEKKAHVDTHWDGLVRGGETKGIGRRGEEAAELPHIPASCPMSSTFHGYETHRHNAP